MTSSLRAEGERAVRPGPLVVGSLLIVVALAIAWLAAWGAPAQPELFSGGACQFAPCGTLEDPARWRAAWTAIGVSVLLAGTGLTVVTAALPARRSRTSVPRVLAGLLLFLAVLPVTAGTLAMVALFSSVPFGVVVAATWAAAFAVLWHLAVFTGHASRWSVLGAAATVVVPFGALMAWFQPWTLGWA